MDSRSTVTRRGGIMLVAWLVLAHLVTGSSMLHGLDAEPEPAGLAGEVAVPMPAAPSVVACDDGGACSVADRSWPPLVAPPGLALFVVLVVPAALALAAMPRRRPGGGQGPAPPLHLSARVVLVI